jgi:hypothetical protein
MAPEIGSLDPAVIKIRPRWRQSLHREVLEKLKQSILILGVKVPISVRRVNDEWELVTGLHRLTACLELGVSVPIREEHCSDIDAVMWEISENLHRVELTALDRSANLAEWTRLCQERDAQSGQVVQIESKRADGRGHRPESGVSKAARELGISEKEVQRAVKINALASEAKAEAAALGLDDNQTALLKAANKPKDD